MTEKDLIEELRRFADERDWQQFHTPKNLVMALAGEAGELVEIFQWLTPKQSMAVMQDATAAQRVRDEIADVYGYLLRLCDVLDVDMQDALAVKIRSNAERYPVERARGSAAKHTDLNPDNR